jgi:hypothetical protein
MKLIQELVDDGNRKRVLDRHRVEGAVVDAKSPRYQVVKGSEPEDRRTSAT